MGVDVTHVDVGGGLGVDYDGSQSTSQASVNYSLQEYANDVVYTLAESCREHELPMPHIISESGRALTAHHALLLLSVIDVESQADNVMPELTDDDDADSPGLRRAYKVVPLTRLDDRRTTLQGAYANNISDNAVRSRQRIFLFAHGHFLIFAPLAALGAGLHVAAYALEGEAEVSDTGVVLSVAIPVALFILAIFVLYALLTRTYDPFHLLLLALTAAVIAASVLLAVAGASVALCLLVLTLAPVVTIVGYETIGHRHMAEALDRL